MIHGTVKGHATILDVTKLDPAPGCLVTKFCLWHGNFMDGS